MSLPPLVGHESAREALGRSAVGGSLPGSLLLHGPAGVGKQRLALWLGQLLLCDAATAAGPCERCRPCRLAVRLEHPDLHWFFPLARPRGAGSPEKLAAALEDARAEALARRREDPLRLDAGDEVLGIYLAQVQTIRRMAVSRPAASQRQVFVVGRAELMVPQEASQEAANAFLKLLEEPPADTVFILTSDHPDALLPTIRSRVLGVPLQPLPPEMVADFLAEQRGVATEAAMLVARLGGGAIGRALALLPTEGGEGPLELMRARSLALLEAAAPGEELERLRLAHALGPAGSRGEFSDVLDFLGIWLRDLAAMAVGADDLLVNQDAARRLQALGARLPYGGRRLAEALTELDRARELARGNVNPQLITISLLERLCGILAGPEARTGPLAPERVVARRGRG